MEIMPLVNVSFNQTSGFISRHTQAPGSLVDKTRLISVTIINTILKLDERVLLHGIGKTPQTIRVSQASLRIRCWYSTDMLPKTLGPKGHKRFELVMIGKMTFCRCSRCRWKPAADNI